MLAPYSADDASANLPSRSASFGPHAANAPSLVRGAGRVSRVGNWEAPCLQSTYASKSQKVGLQPTRFWGTGLVTAFGLSRTTHNFAILLVTPSFCTALRKPHKYPSFQNSDLTFKPARRLINIVRHPTLQRTLQCLESSWKSQTRANLHKTQRKVRRQPY